MIRLWRTERTNTGSNLTHLFLVHPRDDDFCLLRGIQGDARRRIVINRVTQTNRQGDPFAALRRSIADANQTHRAGIAVKRAFNHVGNQRTRQAPADSLLDEGFVQGIQAHLQNRDRALSRLAQLAKKPEDAEAGPMAVGEMADDLTPLLQRSAALYHSAFSVGIKTFPFIREVG